MDVAISSTLLARIRAEAAASPGAEICGLLFGTVDAIAAAQACANVAADPARRFEIDPAALFAAHRRARAGGPAVVGHYHSHPGGSPIPSARDAAHAMGDGALWLIVGADEARLWRTARIGAFDPVRIVGRSGDKSLRRDDNFNDRPLPDGW